MTRHHRLSGFTLAASILIADQVSKWLIINVVGLQAKGLIVLAPVFNLVWVENYGVSMGFLTVESDAERWLLVGLTATIAVAVTIWMWREKARGDVLALALVLGGAVGNILDRVRFGYVVDFLDLHFGDWHPFLVFNVADAAITIGVLLLIARAFLVREKKAPTEKMNA
ncbi:MAG: signal peptidase II [Sphingomonadaceae bacterium]